MEPGNVMAKEQVELLPFRQLMGACAPIKEQKQVSSWTQKYFQINLRRFDEQVNVGTDRLKN